MMFLPALYSQLKYCACILPDGAALIRPTKKVPIRRPGKQRATGQITASGVGKFRNRRLCAFRQQ